MKPILLLTFAISALAAQAESNYTLHSFEKKTLTDVFFSEGANFGDFNRDGHRDVVSGPYWYAGPEFVERHEYYPAKPFDPKGYSDNFFAFTHDLNRDGWIDILVIGFPGKEAIWYENPQGKEGPWKKHVVFGEVDNESPTFADLTGDGHPEIVCNSGGYFGYAEPDWEHPEEEWRFHRITPKGEWQRFTHGLGIGDVNGDGRLDLLEKDGWWEQPPSLENDPEWKRHEVRFSTAGCAHMYADDVDGDGDNDVITCLAAHGYGLAWYENQPKDGKITFKAHVFMGDKPEDNRYGVKFSQLHAVDLVDMNGDGLKDIVTGKRYWAHGPKGDPEPGAAPVLYWFELVRLGEHEVDYVPHLIDDDSGVGTQVVAGKIDNDDWPDVVVGNKKGTFVFLHRVEKVDQATWEKAQPKPRQAD